MKTLSIISALALSHLVSANPAPAAASSSFVPSFSAAPSGSAAPSAAPSGSAAASNFAFAPPASVVASLSVSVAASAVEPPQETVKYNLISTDQSDYCIKYTEDAIKFPGLGSKISGHSWIKMCKNGYWDSYGILRNDDPSGKSHNVGWVWEIRDAKGRYYLFDSGTSCGPYHKLKNKGDICEWNQNWKYNKAIKKHWNSLKKYNSGVGYPLKY